VAETAVKYRGLLRETASGPSGCDIMVTLAEEAGTAATFMLSLSSLRSLKMVRHPHVSNAAMTIKTGTERIVEMKMLSRARMTPAL
jgi:hypothetical protein